MSPQRAVVLVTGAAGRLGSRLLPHLRKHFILRLTDRLPPDDVLEGRTGPVERFVVGDLLDDGVADEAVVGVDAVIHLAGNGDPSALWREVERANVEATQRLLAAASRHGVRRVVYGSSIHAAGAYLRQDRVPVSREWPAQPCCYYGASKVAAEALCQLFAARYGVGVTTLRIGRALPGPDPAQTLFREAWVSESDLAGYVMAGLTRGPAYGVYYAISANTKSLWVTDDARRDLDFTPQDNAEHFLGEGATHLPGRPECFRLDTRA